MGEIESEVEFEEAAPEEIEADSAEETDQPEEFEYNFSTSWENSDGSHGFFRLQVPKEEPTKRLARKTRCLDYRRVCKHLLQEVQDALPEVKFNHYQCQFVVNRYAESIHSLMEALEDWDGFSSEDRVVTYCEEPLRKLMCVMCRGVMLINDCMRKDWWVSVITTSTCSSFSAHVTLHLEDFISCVDTVRISFAEGIGDESFSVPHKTSRTDLAAMVEEANQKDDAGIVERVMDSSGVPSEMKLARFFMQLRSSSKPSRGLSLVQSSDLIYEPGADIGVGAYGRVQIATWNGQLVAVKAITDEHQLKNEVMMLDSVAHPLVVKLIETHFVEDNRQKGQLVLGLMRANLRKLINTRSETRYGGRNPPFELYTAIDIMLQIAIAVRYLHENDVLHCDVKANNVLVDDDDLTSLGHVRIQVADFGLSRKSKDSDVCVSLENAGTPGWMPPEFFESRQNVPYTKASDVYSFAVTCSEILTGEVPFENVHSANLYHKLVAGERPSLPDVCPQHLRRFIEMCWSQNPEKRPSFDQICEMLRFYRGFCIRYRSVSATTLAGVKQHDARELASQLGFCFCMHEGDGLNFSRESEYYPLIYDATNLGFIPYNREDLKKAQVEAGRYYGDWTGSGQDWQKAIKLFQCAADEGEPEALWRLGLCYELGMGTARESERVWPVSRLYETARDGGCSSALVELGLCYAFGIGDLPQDPQAAVRCWKEARLKQLKIGKSCLPSIREMVRHVTKDLSHLNSESTQLQARGQRMAGKRLMELTLEHSVARRLVAGPVNCNVGPLLQAAHDNPNRPDRKVLDTILHNLSQERRIRPTFEKHRKAIEKNGKYWNLVDELSTGFSLSGFLSGLNYLLCFVVVLPFLLFLLLAVAFRASGIMTVFFLLTIGPLSYLLLLVVCFLSSLQGTSNSNNQEEDSDDQHTDSDDQHEDSEILREASDDGHHEDSDDQREDLDNFQSGDSEIIQRLLGEPKVEMKDGEKQNIEVEKEAEKKGKVSDIKFVPVAYFSFLAVMFLFIHRKLALAFFIISMLYLFGLVFYDQHVRVPGPDSDSDDD